jgi:drug/metabolite transporter (DMT)-like permease
MRDSQDDRSLADLFTQLSQDTGTLVRKEIELARTEMSANLKIAGAHAATVAAGGALAYAGLLALIAAMVIGLSRMGVTPWLSALIVGLLTIGVGYLLVNRGLANLRRTSVAPTNAIETMKETARWTTSQKV